MAEYTSCSRHELQRAFALAHKLSESDAVPRTQRIQFREVARLIWRAHGEPGAIPAGAGVELLGTMGAAGQIADVAMGGDGAGAQGEGGRQ